jgi:cytochrome P450
MMISRMVARMFVGRLLCRDREWLRLSDSFSIDFFICAYVLRTIPRWLHSVVAPLLPLRWRVIKALKRSTAIIGPLVEEHLKASAGAVAGDVVEAEDILLYWMMDKCGEAHNSVQQHAALQAFVTMASIHTTSSAVTNLLFDLCANPEWFDVLREEIDRIEADLGKYGERAGVGTALWLPRLEKLDSALAESLRLNPVLLSTDTNRRTLHQELTVSSCE